MASENPVSALAPKSLDGEVLDKADKTSVDHADHDDLFLDIKEWHHRDSEHLSEWRTEAAFELGFVAGHQYTEAEEKALEEAGRPAIVFNRTQPTIESIVGLEIGNRREVQYLPREQGDVQKDEILTSAAEWVRDECDAEDEESDAFFDCVVTGMGWMETRMSYDENPDGMIEISHVSNMEMLHDCNARKRNLKDARRMMRIREMSVSDAQALLADYGDFDAEDLDASWSRIDAEGKPAAHSADKRDAYMQGDPIPDDEDDTMITLIHVQWWEMGKAYKVNLDGKLQTIDEADYDALNAKTKAAGIGKKLKGVKVPKRIYKQAWVGSRVLAVDDAPCPGHFSWQCMTGKRDAKSGTWYGIVRSMRDPQRWANKWLAQGMHILNTQARGGYFAEEGVFTDPRKAEADIAKTGTITTVKKGTFSGSTQGSLVPKQSAGFPTDMMGLMEFAIGSIRDASGVNLELLGLKDQQQAGVLEAQRKQAGMTILAMLFDSLRRYRKMQGRVMLYFITEHISDGRLIRIVGDEGKQYVPLIHQDGTAEYDVIVDDSPTSPNQKEAVWQTITQLMPFMKGVVGPDEMLALAKYSPLPSSVIDDLQKKKAASDEANGPKQAEEAQITKAGAMAEIGLKQAQATKTIAEAKNIDRTDPNPPPASPAAPPADPSAFYKEEAERWKAVKARADAIAAEVAAGLEPSGEIIRPPADPMAPGAGPDATPGAGAPPLVASANPDLGPASADPSMASSGPAMKPPGIPDAGLALNGSAGIAPPDGSSGPPPPPPEAVIGQVAQALSQLGEMYRTGQEANQKSFEMVAHALVSIGAKVDDVTKQADSPVDVERDADGMPVSVTKGGKKRPIRRDSNGKLIGI